MNIPKVIVVLLTCLLSGISSITMQAAKYEVRDETLTVYDDPERTHALGKMHRGDVFESNEKAMSMLVFDYNGKKGMVAEYCCREIAESVPAEKIAEVSEPQTAPVKKDDTSSIGVARKGNTEDELPDWVAHILALFMICGVGVGFWTIFGHSSCEDFFNGLAGEYVANCSTLMKFRPIILFFVVGLINLLTLSMTSVIIGAIIYEVIVIGIRGRQLGSLRAAVVEALYLGLNAIGVVALFAVFVILALIASGGSGKSKKSSSGGGSSRNLTCDNCSYLMDSSLGADRSYCSYGRQLWQRDCDYHSHRR